MLLIVAALAFSAVSGANDGATLVALTLNNRTLRPAASVGILAAMVTIGPLLFGTAVATTVARRLVTFEGQSGTSVLLIAVGAGLAVVLLLQRRGLPTSLNMALTGGIVGGGIGAGFAIGWGAVALTLGLALTAPFASSVMALAVERLLRVLPAQTLMARRLGQIQVLTFVTQCAAYAGNDAQKMVALIAVGAGTADPALRVQPLPMLAVGVCFALGTLYGIERLAPLLGRRVLPMRPVDPAVAELSAAVAVLGSAALATPVSSTQATAAGLIGAGMGVTYRRVRWQEAARIGVAWVVTLPTSAALAGMLAFALHAR